MRLSSDNREETPQKIIWELWIKTTDETNGYEHHRVKTKRHQQQQFFVRQAFMHESREIPLPCTVKFIRLSPGTMDEEDNLRMAFKWIKDQVGACLFPNKSVVYVTKHGKVRENKGHADSDKRVTWAYGQEKSKRLGIRIEISFDISFEQENIVCEEKTQLYQDLHKPVDSIFDLET